MTAIEIHGYAIVSCDDRIADASGATPEALRREADWAYFQAELDRAALTVLGGSGTRSIRTRRPGSGWWSPHRCTPRAAPRRVVVDLAGVPWPEAVAKVLPGGGTVAVPGGQRVFDLFPPSATMSSI